MSYAQSPVITDAGQDLLLKVIGGQNLVFTTVKLGDGALTGTVNEKIQLISEKASVNVNTVAVQDEYATIEAIFDNSKIQSGFYWREIGIFAENPDYPDDRSKDILLAYQNVGDVAEYIPAAGSALIEKIIQIPVVVSSIPTDSISVFLQSNAVQPATKTLETITTFSTPLSAEEFFPVYNKKTDKNQKISVLALKLSMESLLLSPLQNINSGSKVLVSQATPTEDGGNTYLPMASDVTLEELNKLKNLAECETLSLDDWIDTFSAEGVTYNGAVYYYPNLRLIRAYIFSVAQGDGDSPAVESIPFAVIKDAYAPVGKTAIGSAAIITEGSQNEKTRMMQLIPNPFASVSDDKCNCLTICNKEHPDTMGDAITEIIYAEISYFL